jgi:hypothetical protein
MRVNHIREALNGNLAPYNVGIIVPDFLIPLSIGWFLFWVFATRAYHTHPGVRLLAHC